jgi:hypothetical protein
MGNARASGNLFLNFSPTRRALSAHTRRRVDESNRLCFPEIKIIFQLNIARAFELPLASGLALNRTPNASPMPFHNASTSMLLVDEETCNVSQQEKKK